MTDKELFIKGMKYRGFDISSITSPSMGDIDIVPQCLKTTKGDTVLISKIRFVMFEGVNTKPGKLGCIVFNYSGKKRLKYHKRGFRAEILKKAEVYSSVNSALQGYDNWIKETENIMKSWKVIL